MDRLSDSAILKKIERQPKSTAGFKQLVRELGLHGAARQELAARLLRLVSGGQLIEVDSDRYAIPEATASKNVLVGKLSMHRDGYGFVTPDAATLDAHLKAQLSGDIFIPPPAVGSAMHGDRVLVEVGAIRPDGRAEGRIVRPVVRAHSTVVGIFHHGNRGNYVTPIDQKISQEIVIPPGMEYPEEQSPFGATVSRKHKSVDRVLGNEAARRAEWDELEGVVVDVEITDWPSATQNPRGRVVEILGYEDDFGVDVEVVIRKFHLPHHFPPEVLDQAQRIEPIISASEAHKRRDFRALPIVTIDGETARDFDDAVTVRQIEGGNYELQVHIADVAHYVTPDSALDQEARLRGTSVYFPDRAVPMLPLELSTDICSLRPHVDRLVLSCVMKIDHRGEILGYDLCEGVIRSAERMTYTDVNAVLEGDAGTRKRYENLVNPFEMMRDLALILKRKRERRGSIDFDLPEPVIEFDEFGLMKSITRSERNIAHRLIEEFMLSANECVAEYLETETRGFALPYSREARCEAGLRFRSHRRSLRIFAGRGRFAHSAGAVQVRAPRQPRDGQTPAGNRNPKRSSHHTANVPEINGEDRRQAGGTDSFLPDAAFVKASPLFRREPGTLRAGCANLHPLHLSNPPLSRPDRPPHSERSLARIGAKIMWRGRPRPRKRRPRPCRPPGPNAATIPRIARRLNLSEARSPLEELHEIAEESSRSERRADEAERDLMEWKKVKFMQDRVGEDFDGLIISVTKFGFFVELTDLFIEGLVPLDSLTDDRYTFHENTREIIGQRNRKIYGLGQKIRVLVDRIDPVEKKIQFAVLEEKPQRPAKRKRGGRASPLV